MSFWRDERGATAIEYGLIAVLVVIVVVAGMQAMNTNMTSMYNIISTAVLAN